MAEPIAVAFVEIRPEATAFRAETETQVKQALSSTDQVAASLQKVGQVDLAGTLLPITTGAKTAASEVEALTAAVSAVPASIALTTGLADAGAELAAVTTKAALLGEETAVSAAGLTAIGEGAVVAGTGLRSVSAEFTDLIARNRAAQAQAEQFLVTSRQTTATVTEETAALRANAAATAELGRAKQAGASVGGPIPIGGSLLPIALLLIGVQVLGQVATALRVTGNEAGTAEGRFRNFGASLLQFNVVKAFEALTTATHDFSLEELRLISQNTELAKGLNEVGFGASLAKSALAALQQLTKVPAAAQERVAEAAFGGSSSDQISALREEGQRLKEQTDLARVIGAGSAGLNTALADLFTKRAAIRAQIQAITQKQHESLLAGFAEAVTDAQLAGDVKAVELALLNEKAALQGILIPFAASAEERRKFKNQLISVDKEIEQQQQDIAAEIQRHHDAMIQSVLAPSQGVITDATLSGSLQAELAAAQGKANLLKLLIAVETDARTREDLKNQLIAADQQVESIQQQITDEANRHAQDMKDKAAKTRQAFLDSLGLQELTLATALQRAQLSGNIALQERLLQERIAFFKKEEGLFGLATTAGQQAAQNEIAATQTLRDLRHQVVVDQISAREQELQDNVTLAGFTEKVTNDDAAALRKLIAFEKKQSKNKQLSLAERRQHLIAEKQAEKDLAALLKTSKTDGASFQRLSFEFLKTQQGFASGLASNLLPPTATPRVGAGPAAPPSPFAAAPTSAETLRGIGGRGVSSGQGDTLIHLSRETLRAIREGNRASAHPEATRSRQQLAAAMETGRPD